MKNRKKELRKKINDYIQSSGYNLNYKLQLSLDNLRIIIDRSGVNDYREFGLLLDVNYPSYSERDWVLIKMSECEFEMYKCISAYIQGLCVNSYDYMNDVWSGISVEFSIN